MAAQHRKLTFLAPSQYHKIKSLKVCIFFQVCYSSIFVAHFQVSYYILMILITILYNIFFQ